MIDTDRHQNILHSYITFYDSVNYIDNQDVFIYMSEIKMYFGEIQIDRSLPSLDTIAEQVEKNGLIEQDGVLLGIQEGSDRDEYYVSDDYLFVRYVKEVSENHPKIDRGKIQIDKNTYTRLMRLLLTQDGKYVCESTSQVEDNDALEYLIGGHPSGIDFECDHRNQFDPERMERFYNDAWKVRDLKLKENNNVISDTNLIMIWESMLRMLAMWLFEPSSVLNSKIRISDNQISSMDSLKHLVFIK